MTCKFCDRKQHQICVLFLGNQDFECERCAKKNGNQQNIKKYTANALPETQLSSSIEKRVRSYLEAVNVCVRLHVRVVSASNQIAAVKPGMKEVFGCSDYPYQAKTLLAFVEIGGNDVCFFAMYVQEYGSECPTPNTRRIYISFIDSINLFEPKQYRTSIYQEIILGYMDHVKKIGFSTLHLWACPPSKGDDYVFYSHPKNQKVPSQKRLEKWYEEVFNKGMSAGTIQKYKNISESEISDFPYFDGDFWPTVLEELINGLRKPKRIQTSDEGATVKQNSNKIQNKCVANFFSSDNR